jgi:hypothetical protein
MQLDEAFRFIGNLPLFQMQKKRRATVLMKKYPVWFFKLLVDALICFRDIMMEIKRNYF